MSVNRRLLGLAAGQLIFGIIAALLALIALPGFFLDYIMWVPLFGLAQCQAVLLAVWGATSRGPLPVRVAGLIAGAIYLEALLYSLGLPGMSTITVTVTTVTLLVVRVLGVRLIRFADPAHPAPSETEGFRFSIRGLMLVIAGVALLSAGARALLEMPDDSILFTVVWALCSVAVGLVALWAVLDAGRPLRRGPVVFVLSLVCGAFFAFAIGPTAAVWVQLLLIMLLYPTLLFGSLLVVRSCDYRFVRRAVSPSKSPDEQTGSLALEIPASGVAAPE